MFEWWSSLGLTMQIFYCIAIPATLIIVIQTILLMIGLGHGGEGVEFSDTSGIDGLDVPDVSDIPSDVPDISGAHAIAAFHFAGNYDISLCVRLDGCYMHLAWT